VACSPVVGWWPKLGGSVGGLEWTGSCSLFSRGVLSALCRVCAVILLSSGFSLQLYNQQSLNEACFGVLRDPFPVQTKNSTICLLSTRTADSLYRDLVHNNIEMLQVSYQISAFSQINSLCPIIFRSSELYFSSHIESHYHCRFVVHTNRVIFNR
jgi:hypothetical protein